MSLYPSFTPDKIRKQLAYLKRPIEEKIRLLRVERREVTRESPYLATQYDSEIDALLRSIEGIDDVQRTATLVNTATSTVATFAVVADFEIPYITVDDFQVKLVYGGFGGSTDAQALCKGKVGQNITIFGEVYTIVSIDGEEARDLETARELFKESEKQKELEKTTHALAEAKKFNEIKAKQQRVLDEEKRVARERRNGEMNRLIERLNGKTQEISKIQMSDAVRLRGIYLKEEDREIKLLKILLLIKSCRRTKRAIPLIIRRMETVESSLPYGTVIGGAALGLLGATLGPVGMFVGAGIGALIGGSKGSSREEEKVLLNPEKKEWRTFLVRLHQDLREARQIR